MTFESPSSPAVLRQRRWQAKLGDAAAAAVHSRWTWLVVLVWVIAGGILLASGHASVVKAKVAFLPVVAILALATIVLTDDPPAPAAEADSAMTIKRLVVAGVVVAVTAILAWYVASGGSRSGVMAVLTLNWPLSNPWLARSWALVRTALLFVALPLVAMLALKVAPRDLGFHPGHKSWLILAVWTVPILALWGVRFASGLLWPSRLVTQLWILARQRGFFDEFLFRGVLQTRLAKFGSGMSLAVQALVFAGWYAGVSVAAAPGARMAACAATVFVVLPIGVALGIVFARTRNLLAPSILNVLANTIA